MLAIQLDRGNLPGHGAPQPDARSGPAGLVQWPEHQQLRQLRLQGADDRPPLRVLVRPQDAMRRALHILIEALRATQRLRQRLQWRGRVGQGHVCTPKYLRKPSITTSGDPAISS